MSCKNLKIKNLCKVTYNRPNKFYYNCYILFLCAMTAFRLRFFIVILMVAFASGCANIVPPSGGNKDTTPPVLLSVSPKDSLLNTRVTRIEMRFDEFITVTDVSKEINMSPLLPYPLDAMVNGKKLTVKIPDSLLKNNTTYRISFGSSIKDLNENNVFKDFSYMFSTGNYFDSLKLYGMVYDAATGKPAADMNIILYDADETNDSVVVKEKPMYIVKSNATGAFLLPGLPYKPYRIYALKDDDDNLVYGGEEEMIGFIDSIVYPVDSVKITAPIVLRVFRELPLPDSTGVETDTITKKTSMRSRLNKRKDDKENTELGYTVSVDTTDVEKRVHDINKPVRISFSNALDTFNTERVFVSYDSLGIEVEAYFILERDTVPNALLLNTTWKENTVYTIRLLKDFAMDTSKVLAMPSKYIFRTKGDEDYGVLNIHVAKKYYGKKYLLKINTEKDSVYQKPITDTLVTLRRLQPDKYYMSIVIDENGNGKWDTGDLFAKLQPEMVIPYNDAIELKAGWENVIDFKEPVSEPQDNKARARGKSKTTPPVKGDSTGNK